ncbi:MAG TPA: transcription antitermination factor NusB [Cyclobacteriaceae bacterium]|nr:transcription antitermination factor NusB [Cyclobacteriaceae bacterium]
MLNRRTLRIKIMQSLFAYEQCKEADYLLALDHVHAFFQPDLNSMKVQDKALLKGQLQVAVKQFEKQFRTETVKENADPRINEAIEEAMAIYHKQLKKDFDYFRKTIVSEAEKINSYYLSALNLIPTFATLAAQDKKLTAKNFTINPLVTVLLQHPNLKKETGKTGSGWDHRMELVRGWFRDCIKPDKEFQNYLKSDSLSLEDHRAFVKHLVRKLILGNTIINSYFEEEDQRWAEDHEIVRSMVDKTMKSFSEETQTIEIQKLSLDWDEDKEFIDKLFVGAIRLDSSYHKLIADNTKNWEVDRLPLTDQMILHMAIVEMTDFPNIPVKVTINEYIELAKHYSTPKSRQFINGILDVIAKHLKDSGKIKKSGRGLMDNK